MIHRTLIALLTVLALTLTGCSQDSPQALLEDYNLRLARLLDAELPDTHQSHYQSLPNKRGSQLRVDEIRAGMLDTLKLNRCGLLHLVSERNSSLGRVQAPSLMLRYEIRLLDGLRDCLHEMPAKSSQEFQQQVRQLHDQKAAQINRVVGNTLLQSDELRANFTLSARPVDLEAAGFGETLGALAELQALKNQVLSQHPIPVFLLDEVEPSLEILQRYQYGARLLVSTTQFLHGISQSIALLDQHAGTVSCHREKASDQARYLQNVFNKYYVGAIQQQLAWVYQQQRQWEQALTALFTGLPLSPDARLFLEQFNPDSPTSLSEQLKSRARDHAKAWQGLFSRCGLMPTRTT